MIDSEHEVQFGTLHPDGKVTNVRMIKQADIGACPHVIFMATHYRPDGSCKCDDPDERAMMIREWGYEASDFEGPTKSYEVFLIGLAAEGDSEIGRFATHQEASEFISAREDGRYYIDGPDEEEAKS